MKRKDDQSEEIDGNRTQGCRTQENAKRMFDSFIEEELDYLFHE